MSLKPTKGLVVRDWKENVVNLVQYPRCKAVVSPSPFALKLETWLRMNKLNYSNVSNDFSKGSSKGQIPFVEVNGRQFADSNFIIDQLIGQFNLGIDGKLTTKERAEARAITILIEESLFRCLMYYRSRDFSWLANDQGFLPYFTGVKKIIFQKLIVKKIEGGLKRNLQAHGYGRHTLDEIDEIAKKDLTALSTFLGDKHYMFGNHTSTVDATLFGHLTQIYETPIKSEKIKPFIEQNTPNLVAFLKRVKTEYWPDWTDLCQHLAMNPQDIKPEPTATEAP